MKGLLRKDWYMTVKYLWIFWMFAIFFPALMVLVSGKFDEQPPAFLLTFYPCFMLLMSVPMLYMTDEREKWNGYVLTLPVTRARYVTGKYIFGFAYMAASALLSVVFLLICGLEPARVLPLAAVCLLMLALMLLFMFWLGATKGYIIFFSLLLAVFLAFFGYAIATDFEGFDALFEALSHIHVSWPLALLAAVALYALSWGASVALYRRREL